MGSYQFGKYDRANDTISTLFAIPESVRYPPVSWYLTAADDSQVDIIRYVSPGSADARNVPAGLFTFSYDGSQMSAQRRLESPVFGYQPPDYPRNIITVRLFHAEGVLFAFGGDLSGRVVFAPVQELVAAP